MPPKVMNPGEPAPTAYRPVRREAYADWTLLYLLLAAAGAVALLAVLSLPFATLLGDARYAVPSAMHAVAATVYVLVATAAAYLGYRLYAGRLGDLADLRALAALATFFAIITVVFGNWVYLAFPASAAPRPYLLEDNPAVRQVFLDFKQLVALFAVPLAAAATFVLWHEGNGLAARVRLRRAVAVVLVLGWLYVALAFGLGMVIENVRGV